MLWVFDTEFLHPNPSMVYAFNLHAGKMREYGRSVVSSNLQELVGEGRDAAITKYLHWKKDNGSAFAKEAASQREIWAEEENKRNREAALANERRKRQEQARAAQAELARKCRVRRLSESMLQAQKKSQVAIRKTVEARQIQYLTHFTRLENVGGILEKGILPVSDLGETAIRNDLIRLDGYPEAASLSVSFPNYLMFYRYRCLAQDANWAVVTISAEVLTENPCLFFPSNAASGRFRSLDDEGLEALMGIDGFSGMFTDNPPGCRQERALPVKMTTDPQAEVLVFTPVPPTMIRRVRLLRPDTDIASSPLLPDSGMAIGGPLFEPRSDWMHWQGGSEK